MSTVFSILTCLDYKGFGIYLSLQGERREGQDSIGLTKRDLTTCRTDQDRGMNYALRPLKPYCRSDVDSRKSSSP